MTPNDAVRQAGAKAAELLDAVHMMVNTPVLRDGVLIIPKVGEWVAHATRCIELLANRKAVTDEPDGLRRCRLCDGLVVPRSVPPPGPFVCGFCREKISASWVAASKATPNDAVAQKTAGELRAHLRCIDAALTEAGRPPVRSHGDELERIRDLANERDQYKASLSDSVGWKLVFDLRAERDAARGMVYEARKAAAEVDCAEGDAPHEPCMGLAAWIRARAEMHRAETDELRTRGEAAERELAELRQPAKPDRAPVDAEGDGA